MKRKTLKIPKAVAWQSARTLANRLGSSRDTVSRWLAKAGVASKPGKCGGQPATLWSVAEAEAEITKRMAGDGDGVSEKLRTAALKRELLELDVAERKGLVVSREEINEHVARAAGAVRALLVQRFTIELPASILQGLPPDGVRKHCIAAVNQSLEELSKLGEAWSPKGSK